MRFRDIRRIFALMDYQTASKKEVNSLQIQLTEEEQKTIEEFSEKIDLNDWAQIAQYGSSGQKKAAALSNYILEETNDAELPDVREVLEKLENITAEFEKTKFKKQKLKIEKMSIELDKLADELLLLQDQLIKKNLLLEKLYKKNQLHYKELTMYFLAGKKKIEKTSEGDCEQLANKLNDLEVSKMLCMQMAAQIELLKQNHTKLSEKIQCAVNQTIPLWKNQIVMLLEK